MYSEKTLEKYRTKMRELIDMYRHHPAPLSVSLKNDKIGDTMNVSTGALFTCPHGHLCGKICYDIRDCFKFGYDSSTMHARAKNTALLLYHRAEFFRQFREALTRNKPEYCRIHVGGEFISQSHFDETIDMVKDYPDTLFWTYTKEYNFVNTYIAKNGALPKNLIVMMSEWRGLEMENPYGLPEFKVRFKGEDIPTGATWKCPGKCDVCKKAGRGCVASETTWVDEH